MFIIPTKAWIISVDKRIIVLSVSNEANIKSEQFLNSKSVQNMEGK